LYRRAARPESIRCWRCGPNSSPGGKGGIDGVPRDFPPFAGLQRSELDAAEGNPQQARDLVSLGIQQSPDLAVAPLREFDQEMRLSPGSLAHDDGLRAQASNAIFHPPRGLVADEPTCGHDIASDNRRFG
jgi:hypothetical protein